MEIEEIHKLIKDGDFDTVEALVFLDHNILLQTNNDGLTCLHAAARFGQWKILKCLVKAGSDVNARENDERTTLHLMATWSKLNAPQDDSPFRVLAEQGADLNARDSQGRTPLHLAATFNNPQAARALLRLGADWQLRSDIDETPCDTATNLKRTHVLSVLKKWEKDNPHGLVGRQNGFISPVKNIFTIII